MKITPNVPTGAFTLNAWATWDVLFDDNDKAVALFSSKSKLAMAVPEMLELIQQMANSYNHEKSSLELASVLYYLRGEAAALLATMEGTK